MPTALRQPFWLTLLLCFLCAALEGVDIQSMGLSAGKIIGEFGLTTGQFGWAATMSVVGLMAGAALGGRFADRFGRRIVLITSVVALGVFSLVTTTTYDLPMLLVVRFLAGLGMGGAFPNLIAIASEGAAPRRKATAVSAMYCGMPLGGALAAYVVVRGGPTLDWRVIFYLGGVGPLLIAPLLFLFLDHSRPQSRSAPALTVEPLPTILFGEGRASATVLLWIGYFFTLLVVYLLLNWVPVLMAGKGLSRSQAATVSMALNLGAALGSLVLGALLDRTHRRAVVIATYVAMVAALLGLAHLYGFAVLIGAGAFTGFFVIGGQLVLYALAPEVYPVSGRGTGVGTAVAVGRLGSILGPLAGAAMLSAGFDAGVVLGWAVPGLVAAAVAISLVAVRSHARQTGLPSEISASTLP